MYLVEFNNGYESDCANGLEKTFETLEEAKKYARENNEVYYLITDGNWEFNEYGYYEGSGTPLLTNCADKSISWFYSWKADFCEVSDL